MKKLLSLALSFILLVCVIPIGSIAVSAIYYEFYGDFEYWVNDGQAEIIDYIGDDKIIIIPSTIYDDYPVTKINNNAFEDCTTIVNVTIPNSITSIGNSAFKNCTKLTNINIPDSVTYIGGSAFYNCISLTSITIPNSVTAINSGTFQNCANLSNIALPDGITYIYSDAFNNTEYCNNECNWNNNALYIDNYLLDVKETVSGKFVIKEGTKLISGFSGCSNLTNVIIPNSVIGISNNAFHSCDNLTNIEIPDSVTYIGSYAFYGCKSLSNIKLSNNITDIKYNSFFNCVSLTHITIPDGVTLIDDSAFNGCSNLKYINIPNSITNIGYNAFNNCSVLTDVYISGVSLSNISIGLSNDFFKNATKHFVEAGDLDCDGVIKALDLTALRHLLIENGINIFADLNDDRKVNIIDLVALKKKLG